MGDRYGGEFLLLNYLSYEDLFLCIAVFSDIWDWLLFPGKQQPIGCYGPGQGPAS
jgi:hypothetical protein